MLAAPRGSTVTTHALDARGSLRGHVDGVLALCIDASCAPPPGVLLPYDGFLLTVRLPHPGIEPGADGVAPACSSLWPLRSRPDQWQACRKGALTLMAMLRPGAALALMREQPFGERLGEYVGQQPGGQAGGRAGERRGKPAVQAAPLAQVAGSATVARLEAAVRAAVGIDAKLHALASWLEVETVARPQCDPTARRLAAAAAALHTHASMPMAELAALVGVHRRCLERDFSRWYGASPKQVQLAARLQHIARGAWHGTPAAALAADLGLVGAPHLSHTVRELTGMTFSGFTRSAALPALAHAFRTATGGAHLFA
jgi:AraC-like DNA-binding protein